MTNTHFLLITIIVLFSIVLFFIVEYKKKFKFMNEFITSSDQMVVYKHKGPKQSYGQKNIVLTGKKPFSVLVGFDMKFPFIGIVGYDYYGFATSDNQNKIVINSFLGTGSADIKFFVNKNIKDNPVSVSSTKEDQKLKPTVTFKKHWFQW